MGRRAKRISKEDAARLKLAADRATQHASSTRRNAWQNVLVLLASHAGLPLLVEKPAKQHARGDAVPRVNCSIPTLHAGTVCATDDAGTDPADTPARRKANVARRVAFFRHTLRALAARGATVVLERRVYKEGGFPRIKAITYDGARIDEGNVRAVGRGVYDACMSALRSGKKGTAVPLVCGALDFAALVGDAARRDDAFDEGAGAFTLTVDDVCIANDSVITGPH